MVTNLRNSASRWLVLEDYKTINAVLHLCPDSSCLERYHHGVVLNSSVVSVEFKIFTAIRVKINLLLFLGSEAV